MKVFDKTEDEPVDLLEDRLSRVPKEPISSKQDNKAIDFLRVEIYLQAASYEIPFCRIIRDSFLRMRCNAYNQSSDSRLKTDLAAGALVQISLSVPRTASLPFVGTHQCQAKLEVSGSPEGTDERTSRKSSCVSLALRLLPASTSIFTTCSGH